MIVDERIALKPQITLVVVRFALGLGVFTQHLFKVSTEVTKDQVQSP